MLRSAGRLPLGPQAGADRRRKLSASVALSVTADSESNPTKGPAAVEDVSDPAFSTLAHEQGTVTVRDDDVPPAGLIYAACR